MSDYDWTPPRTDYEQEHASATGCGPMEEPEKGIGVTTGKAVHKALKYICFWRW